MYLYFLFTKVPLVFIGHLVTLTRRNSSAPKLQDSVCMCIYSSHTQQKMLFFFIQQIHQRICAELPDKIVVDVLGTFSLHCQRQEAVTSALPSQLLLARRVKFHKHRSFHGNSHSSILQTFNSVFIKKKKKR